MANKIITETTINSTLEDVWRKWITPLDIKNWYHASSDWYVPDAESDLRVGGKFKTVMSACDKTMGFDFEGTYTEVIEYQKISYILADNRTIDITFSTEEDGIKIVELFDPENENPIELQQAGWQAILDNFKHYVENKK
jgi:uncharacterized protein YndB with AHSA1/START domain